MNNKKIKIRIERLILLVAICMIPLVLLLWAWGTCDTDRDKLTQNTPTDMLSLATSVNAQQVDDNNGSTGAMRDNLPPDTEKKPFSSVPGRMHPKAQPPDGKPSTPSGQPLRPARENEPTDSTAPAASSPQLPVQPHAASPSPTTADAGQIGNNDNDPNSQSDNITTAPGTDTTEKSQNESDKVDDETDDGLEIVNLKDFAVKNIIDRIARWTGKVIIPCQEVLEQKITIYSHTKLTRKKALARFYDALRAKGFVAEETDGVIFIKPIKEAKTGMVPTLSPDDVLAKVENKNQIVQKFFRLHNYSPSRLQQIILPLIPEYGYVSADDTTNQLVIIDSVANLLRIEKIIQQLDVPEAEETITQTFQIHQGDPSEIVQLIRLLLGEAGASSRRGNRGRPRQIQPPKPPKHPTSGNFASSVVIGPSNSPIILIPELKRKWIIAKCSADNMKLVADWIQQLDTKQKIESDYSIRPLQYANPDEVAQQINNMLQQMPGQELKANVLVQPLREAGQLMIVGNAENRKMVEKLVDEIDIPTDKLVTEHFKLQYADAEEVQQYIEELFQDQTGRSRGSFFSPFSRFSRYGRGRGQEQDIVRAIAYPTLKQVTVIASAENMKKIRAQIEEWDKPIDAKALAPQIIELVNSDAVKMANLLTKLFSDQQNNNSGRNFFRSIFFGNSSNQKKIVGPLFGQLTFEPVPDTKKIIVISKIPEAYDVVKQLVKTLDQQEPAELPMVVPLKYADSEDLCEQLNAILNETGTPAAIHLSKRGLSNYNAADTTNMNSSNSTNNTTNNRNQQGDTITFWWSQAQRRTNEETPTSNLLGKIRFIPVHRSKAILVLSPKEYQESIKAIIEKLDQPAKQVMIKAIIVEVNHEDLTSLGLQLSTNREALGAAGENAIASTLAKLTYQETYHNAPGAVVKIDSELNPTLLVDFLVKNSHGRILNQPTLWTKDNEEAEFFKGKNVAFKTLAERSAEGTKTSNSFNYQPVGLTLRARPNITPENSVDMTINLIISQVEPEPINGEIAVSDFSTTTHLIVEDSQTILLGGILFQNENNIEKKVPLLGDIPLLGELFKHHSTIQTNTELLAFITPYVLDNKRESNQAVQDNLNKANQKMQDVVGALNDIFDKTNEDKDKDKIKDKKQK